MHNHCINKLLNIKEVIIKKIVHADTFVEIFLETKPKIHVCPVCGSLTKRVHDYRIQTIKDLPFQLKHCYLVLENADTPVPVANVSTKTTISYPNISGGHPD